MKHQIGRASESLCPRRGYAWMIEKTFGQELVVKTNCKTWSCLPCRDRNMAAVRLKIEFGCWTLKRSALITITYVYRGPSTLMSGPAVERHQRVLFTKWRAFCPSLTWFKVPELTKNQQIHLHLVVGGMPDSLELACRDEALYDEEWRSNGACLCLEHRIARLWHDITGKRRHSLSECDNESGCSYVVDARPVLSPSEAAAYLGKYLVKGMDNRATLHRRGFARRWSSSRNWPKASLLTEGGSRERWWRSSFVGGYDEKMEKAAQEDASHYLLKRVGSPEAMEFSDKVVRRAKISRLKARLELT